MIVPNNKTVIVDFDDFCIGNNGLDLLFTIKSYIPNFKANLFTIIGETNGSFLDEVKKLNWIDLIPHGWKHETSRECENWTYEESLNYLNNIESLNLTHGFKAPGWQISDGMYKALLEKKYWVADQAYNNERRPKELKAYILDSPNKHHFHIQNTQSNGLEESMEKILKLNGDFKFIYEVI